MISAVDESDHQPEHLPGAAPEERSPISRSFSRRNCATTPCLPPLCVRPASSTKRSSSVCFAADLVDRARGQHAATDDDRDAVADPLDEVHAVAGEHDGPAGGHVSLEDVDHVRRRHGVDGFERLVEHEQPGRVDHRRREGDLLRHAGRVVGDQAVERILDAERLGEVGRARTHHVVLESAKRPRVVEQLCAGESVEQPEFVGQHTDRALGLDRVGPRVDAVDQDACPRRGGAGR